jgi:hypothetical protein
MRDFFVPVRRQKAKIGVYPSQFYWDSVNKCFYQKTIPDYSIPERLFNKKYYFHTVDPEDRDDFDCAEYIKSIRSAEVHGRVFEPDNPENIVIRDGKRLVNVRERYYDAINRKREKKMAA